MLEMDDLMELLQSSMALEDDELEKIKLALYENVIRLSEHLLDENEESLELIGLKRRVARKLLELIQDPLNSTAQTRSSSIETCAEDPKEISFKEKLKRIEENEHYCKVRFEYVNTCTVYDPVIDKVIKLGAPFKISNVNTRIKQYKGVVKSANMKSRFDLAREMVEIYLTDHDLEFINFTIDRDLMEKGKEYALLKKANEKKRKAQSDQEKAKRTKGL
ncbi:predicted protein [Naegleria gruberi]|uniref:Predicted protein n=1 Tax=Naegleria gruberi TaxID=5762 RepID=D2VLN8_NAEGR|nr:uncharacterized protein NAEGRDRAFT_69847 [Naegleria gruberi]EFC42172.1 predicted protein [Naegleria gruberi]|eukprot:XP_002674916.1 predicted protein [Naegleria gruberi strain NEG-M]